jgi:hypothetical protein
MAAVNTGNYLEEVTGSGRAPVPGGKCASSGVPLSRETDSVAEGLVCPLAGAVVLLTETSPRSARRSHEVRRRLPT